MGKTIRAITYTEGLIRRSVDRDKLPGKLWLASDLSPEVTKAIEEEGILSLGGAYGDANAATPVQYDHLLIALEGGEYVDIEVFNLAATLFESNDEKLVRIHRFLSALSKNPPPFDKLSDDTSASSVPAGDDLAGWEAANKALVFRYGDEMDRSSRRDESRPVKRYFGDADLDYYIDGFGKLGSAIAFLSWGMFEYGAIGGRRTRAEKMLEKGLPEAQATLLRAKMESYPTLYRVTGHEERGEARLEDVLLGGAVTARTTWPLTDIEEGMFIIGRVFEAGEFRFFEMAGPPMVPEMVDEAIGRLRDKGMEFTREGLRRGAHLFGRLWDWLQEWNADQSQIGQQNSDDEDIIWHTAAFSVADEADVRKRLAERDDIDLSEDKDVYVWVGKARKEAGPFNDMLLLGNIRVIEGSLILVVNSPERFERARKWLEEMPGVKLSDVKRGDIRELLRDAGEVSPSSEDGAIELTAEAHARWQAMANQRLMQWLDTPLSILGGKTPREVSRTSEGRGLVAELIRGIPDTSDPTLKPPREAMLKELGLPVRPVREERGFDPAEDIELEDLERPRVKVGRNDPCPCGSGKKYKKCCGR